MLVYKICPTSLWREAESTGGRFRGAPVDHEDGFIHLSTPSQLRATARKHFAGQDDLLLISVAEEALGGALRWEVSRGGDLFPHLYGALRVDEVDAVVPLRLGPDGVHLFPPEIPAEPFDPAAAGWTPTTAERFIGLVGPVWIAPGETGHYGLLAEARHMNRGNVMHGGMVMTFADQALGLTAAAENRDRRQVTVQLDTHFVDGIRAGEFAEARCRAVRKTGSLLFMTGEITVASRPVATASGVWKMLGPSRRRTA